MVSFKDFVHEGFIKSISYDISKIDASNIEDGISMTDMKDMVLRDKGLDGCFYNVDENLYLLKQNSLFLIKDVKCKYDWDNRTYVLSLREGEIPPIEVIKIVKGKTLLDQRTNLPIVFYHGSDKDFEKFNDEFAGTEFGSMNEFTGHYFSQREEYAEGFGKHVHKACLIIKKPLYQPDKSKAMREWSKDKESKLGFQSWLIDKGYDAVVHISRTSKYIYELVVFLADQIVNFDKYIHNN